MKKLRVALCITELEWGGAEQCLVRLAAGMDRDAVIASLRDQGIGAGILSYALTRIGSLAPLGQSAPTAEDVVDRGLALPVYPAMADADVAAVLAALAVAAG